ncbi:hypothetical protein [Caballeronia mineralivorans]|jgi:hypothetical protein|uniref:hypothetical protein n=1 Tax=Caballeronia mineralivorans TaxID=2010198 RepID=UPI002AFFFC64|nr:hypothetical protein [Caballeronia mineralivorans]MEA3099478.1 hypothetical protein [Caballeronia mineralivorans]
MSKADSIGQTATQTLAWILARLGSKYPALANYRLFHLERHKLLHLAIAAVVLVLGTLSHYMPESLPWTIWIVAFVIIAETALVWVEYLALAEPRNQNIRVTDVFPEILTRIKKVPPSYSLKVLGDGAVARSDAVDSWIQTKPVIPLEIQGTNTEDRILKYNEAHLLEAFDYLVKRLQDSGKRFFNDKKVSLRTELNVDQLTQPGRMVTLGKTSYIASALTNDACVNRLVREKAPPETIYADLTEMYPLTIRNGDAHLLSLDDSQLSNHMGASTIALFRQTNGTCVVVLPEQGAKAARSAGLLAPTGSGSLDWADVSHSSSKDLLTLVTRGANRELCEEQGILGLGREGRPLDELLKLHRVDTYVLGYFRWLNFGGLPQFCCMSTVRDVNVEDLRPDERELGPYASSASHPYQKRAITSVEDLGAYCDDLLTKPERLSVPLAVNLALLKGLIGDPARGPGHAKLSTMINSLLSGRSQS